MLIVPCRNAGQLAQHLTPTLNPILSSVIEGRLLGLEKQEVFDNAKFLYSDALPLETLELEIANFIRLVYGNIQPNVNGIVTVHEYMYEYGNCSEMGMVLADPQALIVYGN